MLRETKRFKPFSPTEHNGEESHGVLGARALVPLCIHEAASRHAQTHLRRFSPVVWWGRLVEVYSAINRLHREKEITDLDKQGAAARLQLLSHGWREILPGDQVRELATQSLDKFSLRALIASSSPHP